MKKVKACIFMLFLACFPGYSQVGVIEPGTWSVKQIDDSRGNFNWSGGSLVLMEDHRYLITFKANAGTEVVREFGIWEVLNDSISFISRYFESLPKYSVFDNKNLSFHLSKKENQVQLKNKTTTFELTRVLFSGWYFDKRKGVRDFLFFSIPQDTLIHRGKGGYLLYWNKKHPTDFALPYSTPGDSALFRQIRINPAIMRNNPDEVNFEYGYQLGFSSDTMSNLQTVEKEFFISDVTYVFYGNKGYKNALKTIQLLSDTLGKSGASLRTEKYKLKRKNLYYISTSSGIVPGTITISLTVDNQNPNCFKVLIREYYYKWSTTHY